MRMAQSVSIPESERAILVALANKAKLVRLRTSLRAQAILFASKGKTNEEIAQLVGTTRQTVSRWRHLYVEFGMAAIVSDLPRSGRTPVMTKKMTAELIKLRRQKKDGNGEPWTHQKLATHFEVSVSTVRNVLRQHTNKKA